MTIFFQNKYTVASHHTTEYHEQLYFLEEEILYALQRCWLAKRSMGLKLQKKKNRDCSHWPNAPHRLLRPLTVYLINLRKGFKQTKWFQTKLAERLFGMSFFFHVKKFRMHKLFFLSKPLTFIHPPEKHKNSNNQACRDKELRTNTEKT